MRGVALVLCTLCCACLGLATAWVRIDGWKWQKSVTLKAAAAATTTTKTTTTTTTTKTTTSPVTVKPDGWKWSSSPIPVTSVIGWSWGQLQVEFLV